MSKHGKGTLSERMEHTQYARFEEHRNDARTRANRVELAATTASRINAAFCGWEV